MLTSCSSSAACLRPDIQSDADKLTVHCNDAYAPCQHSDSQSTASLDTPEAASPSLAVCADPNGDTATLGAGELAIAQAMQLDNQTASDSLAAQCPTEDNQVAGEAATQCCAPDDVGNGRARQILAGSADPAALQTEANDAVSSAASQPFEGAGSMTPDCTSHLQAQTSAATSTTLDAKYFPPASHQLSVAASVQPHKVLSGVPVFQPSMQDSGNTVSLPTEQRAHDKQTDEKASSQAGAVLVNPEVATASDPEVAPASTQCANDADVPHAVWMLSLGSTLDATGTGMASLPDQPHPDVTQAANGANVISQLERSVTAHLAGCDIGAASPASLPPSASASSDAAGSICEYNKRDASNSSQPESKGQPNVATSGQSNLTSSVETATHSSTEGAEGLPASGDARMAVPHVASYATLARPAQATGIHRQESLLSEWQGPASSAEHDDHGSSSASSHHNDAGSANLKPFMPCAYKQQIKAPPALDASAAQGLRDEATEQQGSSAMDIEFLCPMTVRDVQQQLRW
jgi:hypothetical protein